MASQTELKELLAEWEEVKIRFDAILKHKGYCDASERLEIQTMIALLRAITQGGDEK